MESDPLTELYGLTVHINPTYTDEAQRLRLRKLFWEGDEIASSFAEALSESAATVLCKEAEEALGDVAYEVEVGAYAESAEDAGERFEWFGIELDLICTPADLESVAEFIESEPLEERLLASLRDVLQAKLGGEKLALEYEIFEYGGAEADEDDEEDLRS
jgi:hypothetical protein